MKRTYSRAQPLRQPEHVNGAMDAGLDRLDRLVLIMDQRGRAGGIVNLVHFDIERHGHVVTHRLELRIGQ
jgi:hypothetical protein